MTEAIYFFVDENGNYVRIDSRMIEPMHTAGYSIVKMWLNDEHTEERLDPNETIPEGFITDSFYGFTIYKTKEE
jgi:hypothetical protein